MHRRVSRKEKCDSLILCLIIDAYIIEKVKQEPDVFEHAKIQRKCVPRVLLEDILKVQQNGLQPDRKRMAQWQKDGVVNHFSVDHRLTKLWELWLQNRK